MTVLVTGGAGYIGSHMVHALVDIGEQGPWLDHADARRLALFVPFRGTSTEGHALITLKLDPLWYI
jgi:UDP-glucose 4-epimerase